jgi:putative ABC transport system permease protein
MRFLRLIVRNLFRNTRRTILTVASVAVSIFVFAALLSLPGVINQILRDRASSLRLVSHSKAGFFYALPEAYRRRIATIPHVEAVSGESVFMGTYRDPKDLIPSAAIDPEQVEEIWPDWAISREEGERFRRARGAALVGPTLMRLYRWKLGDQVTLRGTIYPVDVQVEIVGTLGDKAPPIALLFRRDRLDEALGRPGTVNLFWVKVDSSRSIPGVIAEIDERFANSAAETMTETELGISVSQMGGLRVILAGSKVLAAIVIFAIALVAANTAAMSVRERRQSFAVMRAIGFTRELLLCCLAGEGLLIGVAGGLLGCVSALAILRLVPYLSRSLGMLALLITLPRRVMAQSFAVAALIGILSALAPAIIALRREISGELRAVA